MSNAPLINNDVNDFGQFARLRGAARNNDPEALKGAARQFEALFTQQMLKSARATKFGGDLMSNDQTEFYQGMFDQQLSMKMSEGDGLGLANLLVRQLQARQSSAPATPAGEPIPLTRSSAMCEALPLKSSSSGTAAAQEPDRVIGLPLHVAAQRHMKPLVFHPSVVKPVAPPTPQNVPAGAHKALDFVNEMLPHAEAAARELGVPAHVLVAQAALETGWGKHQIKNADGTPSYNFFGIKADRSWDGDRVTRPTTEYANGVAHRERAAFRSYDTPEAAFQDYVRFLKTQPRYARALDHGGDAQQFVAGLQKAGYATDPAYADKIHRIASGRLMNAALASQPVPPRELSV